MANFTNIQITNLGRALQAKAQAGTALKFTRFRLGSGTMGGQQIAEMTNVIQPVMWLPLNKSQAHSTGRHTLGAQFNNSSLATGFYFREWGVFAEDPDVGEIMYCYGNVGVGAEYIPAGGGSEIVEQQLDIITLIGNAASVSAVIDSSLVYVSASDFETAMIGKVDKVAGKGLSSEDYTSEEKRRLAGMASGANNYVHPATHPPSIIAQDANNRFATDAEKAALSAATAAATPNTLAKRDAAGRIRAPAPTDMTDVAIRANILVPPFAVTTGTGANYNVAFDPPIPSLIYGMRITVQLHVASLENPRINVDNLGPVSIFRSTLTPLPSGLLKQYSIHTLIYNGVAFQLSGEGGEYGNATTADVLVGKTIGTEAGITTGSMPSRKYMEPAQGYWTDGAGNLAFKMPVGAYVTEGGFGAGFAAPLGNDPNFTASNILAGVGIFGLVGSLVPKGRTATGVALAANSGNGDITVTGLAFRPRFIVAFISGGDNWQAIYIGAAYTGLAQLSIRKFSSNQFTSGDFTIGENFFRASTIRGYNIGWFAAE